MTGNVDTPLKVLKGDGSKGVCLKNTAMLSQTGNHNFQPAGYFCLGVLGELLPVCIPRSGLLQQHCEEHLPYCSARQPRTSY